MQLGGTRFGGRANFQAKEHLANGVDNKISDYLSAGAHGQMAGRRRSRTGYPTETLIE